MTISVKSLEKPLNGLVEAAKSIPSPPLTANEDEGEDDSEGEIDPAAPAGEKKKKKKKKSKKKKTTTALVQSDPPRLPLTNWFSDDKWPVGEIQEYKNDNAYRTSSAELREKERLLQEDPETTYRDIRRGAEVHRQVRAHARKVIRPGMTMMEIVENIEAGTRGLVDEDGFKAGIGFPTGVSLNEVAAHYTPNSGDKTVLKDGDMMKVDFGVHVNGRIVDSAFTMSFDEDDKYGELLKAVRDATDTGIREMGIDVTLTSIGAAIQETMESYEVVIGTTTYPIKSIANLNGHSIDRYKIHGGKSIPIVANGDETRMEEGEYFALETFGSTGRGKVWEEGACSHYSREKLKETAKSLLKTINTHFDTLPFCRRYLDRLGESGYLLGLNELVAHGIVNEHPPLTDIKGSMTAQFEHTILLRPTCKEIVSRGDDY